MFLLKIPESNFSIFLFFFGGGGEGAFWSENEYRFCLSGMVFEGTMEVHERVYHFSFK